MASLAPLRDRVTAPPTVRPSHPLVAEWRPLTAADAETVWRLRQAADAVDHPNYLANRDEVVEELGYSFIDLAEDSLLAIGHDGAALAYGLLFEPPRQETLVREFVNGCVHPAHRGRGIGRELIRWQRARGEQKLAASDKTLPGWLVGYADQRAPDRERLLRAAGFTPARWFHTMERDLRDPIPDVTPREAVSIVPYSAERATEAHDVRDSAFRDHWGSQPLSDEQWTSLVGGVFVAELSFLAVAPDGELAGLVLTDVNEEDWPGQGYSGAYISTVAVTRPYRGKRIAPALLAAVLRASAERGYEKVVLDVDADNPTGALGLYTGMGFSSVHSETGLVIEY